MIDRNHPALKAGAQQLSDYENDGRTYPPIELHYEAAQDALEAAWPELTTATEDNLARLRDTPAGRALMAEALGKVLAVHTPKDNGRVSPCCSCEQWIESSDDEACIEYPCPTVEAITTALEGGTQ